MLSGSTLVEESMQQLEDELEKFIIQTFETNGLTYEDFDKEENSFLEAHADDEKVFGDTLAFQNFFTAFVYLKKNGLSNAANRETISKDYLNAGYIAKFLFETIQAGILKKDDPNDPYRELIVQKFYLRPKDIIRLHKEGILDNQTCYALLKSNIYDADSSEKITDLLIYFNRVGLRESFIAKLSNYSNAAVIYTHDNLSHLEKTNTLTKENCQNILNRFSGKPIWASSSQKSTLYQTPLALTDIEELPPSLESQFKKLP